MGMQKAQKFLFSHLPNAISPPDEHALYKDNAATVNAFSAPDAALLLVLIRRSAASGDENAWNCKLWKVTADIAQRAGNVIIIPVS